MHRQGIVYERFLNGKLRIYLLRLYRNIAKKYGGGKLNWESELTDSRPLFVLLMNFYQRVFVNSSNLLFESVDEQTKKYHRLGAYMEKDLRSTFWEQFRNFMRSYCAQRVTDINKTTRKRIQYVIDRGIEDEIGRQGITKKLMAISAIQSRHRARLIAATETHSGMSFAIHQAAKTERIIREHEWMTAHDERVRRPHVLADGQRVPIGTPFSVGGEQLDHPGDPKGSAANIIRCRCVEIFHTKREGLYR
jgi:uncharacterized protein with gpF-like domain